MEKKSILNNNLGACEICKHCVVYHHPWYYCENDNMNFGNIIFPKECKEFESVDVDDKENNNDDVFDATKPKECPNCGSDAYWNGSEYECENCDWCGK